jgi:hypothetical protein
MALFKPAENNAAYLKAAFMGLAGSGKTYTACSLAIGMVQHMQKLKLPQADKPVYFVDSEGGSSWMVAQFKDAGIPLQVAATTAFTDLAQAMAIARDEASVLLIDSITAFWVEFTETYKEKKGRKRGLEFQDWGWLKNEWRNKFTTRFLNDPIHAIMCGRMGFEYEHYVDDTGKRQIEKTGVKLKAESELGYEPSLLVQMEREHDLDANKIVHVAHVLKDRRPDIKSLDGKTIKNPSFASFLPHVEYLNLGGTQRGFDEKSNSAAMIPDDPARDNNHTRREIVVEELDSLLLEHGLGGSSQESKMKRAELVKKHFKSSSRTEIEKLMSLHELQVNFDSLHRELTGKPSRYDRTPAPPVDDEIPHMEPAAQSLPAPQEAKPDLAISVEAKPDAPNDLDTIIVDFGTAIDKAGDATERKRLWDETAEARAVMDSARIEKMRLIYGKALMSRNGKAPPRNTKRPEAQVEAAE